MNMRTQFVQTVESLLGVDSRLVLLLGDIGVYGFRKAFASFPDRVYNIGILEQATVSLASGLASTGLIPVFHTIAPFIVERCLEQLKVDFCYQRIGGNFVSVGASYDYAALGCTHHCPSDIGILQNLPGMEIVVPGTAGEFDRLFRQAYADGHPTYFRLSERENPVDRSVIFGKADVIRSGKRATVVAVGTALGPVLEATGDMDVSVLYYTTVAPFDADNLMEHCFTPKILLVEPYYSGGLAGEICAAFCARPIALDCIGVPRRFLTDYGITEEHDEVIGFTAGMIQSRLEKLINES